MKEERGNRMVGILPENGAASLVLVVVCLRERLLGY